MVRARFIENPMGVVRIEAEFSRHGAAPALCCHLLGAFEQAGAVFAGRDCQCRDGHFAFIEENSIAMSPRTLPES
jgi:hypothetical protein